MSAPPLTAFLTGARPCALVCACLLGFLAPVAGAQTPPKPVTPTEPAPQDEEAAPPTPVDPALLPPELHGAAVAYLWSFDRDGERQGWKNTSAGLSETMALDGRLHAQITGPDPYVVGPPIQVDSSAFQFLALRCRATISGVTEIFFSREQFPGFFETQMIKIPMTPSDDPRVYEIDLRNRLRWHGTIEKLRIDPLNADETIGGRIEIDWIAVYQAPGRVVPHLPHWADENTLELGFENRGGSPTSGPLALSVDGATVASVPVLATRTGSAVTVDASNLPPRFWLEAALDGQVVWRGRMVRPCSEAVHERARPPGEGDDAPPAVVIACGTGRLSQGPHRSVVLAPMASLTVRGPGPGFTYYEFDVAPAGTSGGDALYREILSDPLLSELTCTVRVRGTDVRTRIETSDAVQVVRFEGPRMMQTRTPTHALFPGLEYMEAGENSSSSVWTGTVHAARTTPSAVKITAPTIAIEYDRVHGLPPHDPAQTSWVATLSWDIDPRPGRPQSATVAEFRSSEGEPSFATTFLPARAVDLDLDDRYAPEPWPLDAAQGLEIRTSFGIGPGTIEDVFAQIWLPRAPAPPAMRWLTAGEADPAARPVGPGSVEALERILATTMLAYTRTLFRDGLRGGLWKSHIAIQEPYDDRPEFGAAILAESARSGKSDYLHAVGIPVGDQIESRIGTAADLIGTKRRKPAAEALGEMSADGSIGYTLTAEMEAKIRELTVLHGAKGDALGDLGATNAGLIASRSLPLLEYAACTRDPIYVAAALRALARMNQFTVPRGAQTWEIHSDTPDLFAAAQCARADLWGWRLTGDEKYLDEAQRWLNTGLPFLYWWEPPDRRYIAAVQVADELGEGPNLEQREPTLFYADARRQVMPYASIPVFGTSWFAVPWFGIPVQWCGLAWANAVREIDAIRPLPDYVRVADGVFRSAVNQQCDESYLAGTIPDSWEVAQRLSRQPYIAPERLLEYAYRELDAPYVESIHYARVPGPRWTHVASHALLKRVEQAPGVLTIDARFVPGQTASLLVGGPRGDVRRVRVNGRELTLGNKPDQYSWIECGDGRGALVVPWIAAQNDRITIETANAGVNGGGE